jgi:nucleotide-binding universal stress UspA family protein
VDVVAVAMAGLPVLVGAAVGAEGGFAEAGETERQMRLAAGDDAEACAATLRDHEFVATESVMASPTATALLERIDYSGADLAVVGALGTGGFRELVVGSVSDRVVGNAPATLVGRHPPFTRFGELVR